ncbi:hypothetical protein FSARC_4149 [Fusarium sarcochroum]|uniref:DJ-1/PfpI domain-containing protein n=1 Tax=Fusarium sarcochroum TaxID=1208366 RepID=A0A8H4U2W1_9HYPO|nr:hypothetical protein FSARC_4149 [Fusarium sarcochroum]
MLFKSLVTQAVLASASLVCASAHKRQEDVPTKWGLLAYPGVDTMDIYGPLEVLYFVASNRQLSVKIINPTEDNVVVKPPMGNKYNSTYAPEIVGSATMEDLDIDLDVLVVPGGAVARDPNTQYIDEYLVKMFPRVKHFVTVCTGALFAARAGLLDNRRATTNKGAWSTVTEHGTNVTWVAPARFVRDGNLWTSSGVSAGIDMTFAMVKEFYGQELHDRITVFTEVLPRAHDDDPFTDIVGIPHQGQLNQTRNAN